MNDKVATAVSPNSTATAKLAGQADATDKPYLLKLFVTGSTPRSLRAIMNLQAILEEHLAGRYELQIVDLYQQPELAKDNQLVAAPTLIKRLPEPARRVIGDMSNTAEVLFGLDIAAK